MRQIKPILMKPCYKEYLWGGSRLKQNYGKIDAPDIAAESWELSCHPDGLTRVGNGEFQGETLLELAQKQGNQWFGRQCKNELPVLVKLIDAKQNLSIQVHPSDQTARPEFGERGKAEMWYIVDCEPHAYIYYGFSKQIDQDEMIKRAKDGSICQVLNKVHVSPGDVFYILPGTIHAIGAGNLIAEIQQSSNTTFRVYDYQRVGADGKQRELHLERAAQVMNYKPIIPEECRANSSAVFPGFVLSEMFSCSYFRAFRLDVNGRVMLKCDEDSFQHLLCVEGAATLTVGGEAYPISRGQSYFLPANLGNYTIQGNSRILLSRM